MGPSISGKRVLAEAALYCGAVFLCLLLLVGVLKLWKADPFVPFAYDGDSLQVNSWIKGMMDNGWHLRNDYLGAPLGADLHDVPKIENLHFGVMKLLAYFVASDAAVYNLYFLLTFPLTTLIALCVLRQLGIGRLAALGGSLLFTFLPCHFMRGLPHLFLASYYLIPLLVLLAVGVWSRDRLFLVPREESGYGARFKLWSISALSAIIICGLAASAGMDYAFCACFLFMIAGFAAAIDQQSWRPLGNATILVAFVGLGMLANLSPNLLYVWEHGRNPAGAVRGPQFMEPFGLKIAQLLLPITGHRLPFLASLKARYNANSLLNTENDLSTLGLVGSIGFLYLLARLIYRRGSESRPELCDHLSVLNIFAILLATVGGLGMVFGVSVSSWIRCYNRISVFIGFFSLVAVAILADRVLQKWNVYVRTRVLLVLVCLVVAGGVYDQTTWCYRPNYEAAKEAYVEDAEFVGRIEALLPERAMIYQLPYAEYPGNVLFVNGMKIYDHFRGYLHSRTLRWSSGAVRGREADNWVKKVGALPPEELCNKLSEAGFAGIYVDRYAFLDRAAALESKLSALLGPPGVVSSSGRLSFFELNHYRSKNAPTGMQTAQR